MSDETKILDGNVQLLCLDRNQKEIAQFLGKLCSYISEPKTHEQFVQINRLKDKGRELRGANKEISSMLQDESNDAVRSSKLLNAHLEKFEVFSGEVLSYLGKIRLDRTRHHNNK